MKYAIIADIHGNLEALTAVTGAAAKEKVDAYLCIGDVVGYGADPAETIRLTRSLDPKVVVAGNHEWGVLGLLDIDYFNEYAAAAIEWTKGVLSQEDLDYLKSFRMEYDEGNFTLVHGSLDMPAKFSYILDEDDAYITMKLMRTPVCFVGHTHLPGIFYFEDGTIQFTKGPEVKLEHEKKYIINVGSVGQPRDGDPRASYVIYDDTLSTVVVKRVAYDIEAAQKKIKKAGLPAWLAGRLAEGR